MIQSQSGQIVHETLSQKKKKKKPPQKRAGRVQNSGIENKIEIVLTIFSIRKQDTKLYCVDSTLTM
jgi:hypothetical protein